MKMKKKCMLIVRGKQNEIKDSKIDIKIRRELN